MPRFLELRHLGRFFYPALEEDIDNFDFNEYYRVDNTARFPFVVTTCHAFFYREITGRIYVDLESGAVALKNLA